MEGEEEEEGVLYECFVCNSMVKIVAFPGPGDPRCPNCNECILATDVEPQEFHIPKAVIDAYTGPSKYFLSFADNLRVDHLLNCFEKKGYFKYGKFTVVQIRDGFEVNHHLVNKRLALRALAGTTGVPSSREGYMIPYIMNPLSNEDAEECGIFSTKRLYTIGIVEDDELTEEASMQLTMLNAYEINDQIMRSGAPPASVSLVENLVNYTLTEASKELDEECLICKAKYLPDDRLLKMDDCDHYFHLTCITTWLNTTNSCPICRSTLKTDDPAFDYFQEKLRRDSTRALGESSSGEDGGLNGPALLFVFVTFLLVAIGVRRLLR